MGLSVGIVTIDYDHSPPLSVRDFLTDFSSDPALGDYDDDAADGYWPGDMDEAGILLIHQEEATERAENWCRDQNLADAARDELLTWLGNLP